MSGLTVAVVGVGSFGRHHVRHLSRHPLVRRVLVVDRDAARAAAVAREHGADVAASLEAAHADAVVVTTPTATHRDLTLASFGAGAHVFVEKPVAATTGEAREMVEAARAAARVLQVGHVERFDPAFNALAARLAGPPTALRARRHNPPRPVPPAVDVVLDLMIHDIDLVLSLVGSRPLSVSATMPSREEASATLTFPGGVRANLSASRVAAAPSRVFEAMAGGATLRADLVDGTLSRLGPNGAAVVEMVDGRDKLAAELDDFLRAIAGARSATVDGRAGLAALEVAERVLAAGNAGALPLTA